MAHFKDVRGSRLSRNNSGYILPRAARLWPRRPVRHFAAPEVAMSKHLRSWCAAPREAASRGL
eukprot:9979263-Alexandrium_andersonii.AAC.1